MGAGVVLFVFLCYNLRIKVLLYTVVLIIIVWLLMQRFMPNFLLFLTSIGDDSIGGSSIDMRTEQLRGCINAIQENPVFGLGYGWTGWYRSTIGRHPTMFSFESCLIQILCNNGIMGLLLWGTMVALIFRSLSKLYRENVELKRTISLLLIAYFSYTFYTGDYATFRVMLIFYAIIVSNEISGLEVNQFSIVFQRLKKVCFKL